MRKIGASELVLNSDGSVYHLNLRPENISTNIITVGDPKRVDIVAEFFDRIEFETVKREFHTVTGSYKGTRFTVISTGIGPDNIDIVLNELDALVNIDLEKRTEKEEHTSLNIVRIGTSGSLQADIPVDSFVLGKYGLGLDGLLHYYKSEHVRALEAEKRFAEQTGWLKDAAKPYFVRNSPELEKKLEGENVYKGITATAGGFYGPQGRVLRIPLADPDMHDKLHAFEYDGVKITNFEMETAAIYGLAKLLGHRACSMNAIIANRKTLDFSADYKKTIRELIEYVLNALV
jgi:uridine phosphorylase